MARFEDSAIIWLVEAIIWLAEAIISLVEAIIFAGWSHHLTGWSHHLTGWGHHLSSHHLTGYIWLEIPGHIYKDRYIYGLWKKIESYVWKKSFQQQTLVVMVCNSILRVVRALLLSSSRHRAWPSGWTNPVRMLNPRLPSTCSFSNFSDIVSDKISSVLVLEISNDVRTESEIGPLRSELSQILSHLAT